jgi:pimeloyl-ACP methyl ester carboxylesterase
MTAQADPDGPPRHDVPINGHSSFTIVDGQQVHYLAWGRRGAAPVVCLHGGGQTAYMYEELGSALRDRWFALAPDLTGHGDSDADAALGTPTAGLDRRSLAASVVRFLDFVGIERAVFVGASLGGITSLTIAAIDPNRVEGIVLIDIGHRLEDDGVRRIVDFMTKHESFVSLDEAAVAIAEYLPGRKKQSPARLTRNLRQRADGRWVWKHALGRNLRSASASASPNDSNDSDGSSAPGDWRGLTAGMDAELARLACPVLVLRGAQSDVLSDEGAREVAALVPNARVATINAAGHLAAGDNSESTVSLVRHFLEETGW